MIKVKFFLSILKERDWLEEMARKGFLLTNLQLGIIYHFTPITPGEKVYEIERFAITSHPTVSELTAKTRALDITSQFGWKQITHDESMNYYFVKDKAGDETDEFYDTAEFRAERAQRYRQYYSVEGPLDLIKFLLFFSALFFFLIFVCHQDADLQRRLMWIYIIVAIIEFTIIYLSMKYGQQYYTEFSMSRKEWTQYKKHKEKKSFRKVQQLRSYLQEKSEFGLSLIRHENGHFIFEEDSQRYNYFVDTKKSLKKRLLKEGHPFTEESKDLQTQSLKWYETSIAYAAQYGLKPVAVINKNLLIYKRPYSEEALPWENGNENIGFLVPAFKVILFYLVCFAIGFIIGTLSAFFTKYII